VRGEQEHAATAGNGLVKVFAADDFVGREAIIRSPPRESGFEEADGEGAEMSGGEGAAVAVRQLRKTEFEIHFHNVAAQADDVEKQPAETRTEGYL
jgi:hypothetical protein